MKEENAILRLARPKKKGLLRLLFSRVFLIALLFALQIFVFAALFALFRQIVPYYTAFQLVFIVGVVVYLFNNSMDSSAKLTWLVVLSLFPIPGAIFLVFTQSNFGHRTLRERVEGLIAETKDALPQDEAVLAALSPFEGRLYGADAGTLTRGIFE